MTRRGNPWPVPGVHSSRLRFAAGDRVRPAGNLPATVITGFPDSRGRILVEFATGHRAGYLPEQLERI